MKKNLVKLMVIIMVLGTIVSFSACSANDNTELTTATTSIETSTMDTTSGSIQVQESTQVTETSSTTETTTSTTTETTTKKKKVTTTEKNSSVTVNQALDLLSRHYGSSYEVNGTVNEGNYYYFAITKDGEKYASVRVNLTNGNAKETLTATGKTSSFSL